MMAKRSCRWASIADNCLEGIHRKQPRKDTKVTHHYFIILLFYLGAIMWGTYGLTPIFRPKECPMKCSFMFCLSAIKCHPSPSPWPEIPGMPFPVLQDAQNELMDSGSQADIQAHFWSHAQRLGENVDSKDEYCKLGLCRVLTCAYYIYIHIHTVLYNTLYVIYYL